ncbi:Cna B-type domain-containing protein [Alloscardovia theropitheci]|nr:Cna B-type domain-containing protein [Alloscardovia theropitheci]
MKSGFSLRKLVTLIMVTVAVVAVSISGFIIAAPRAAAVTGTTTVHVSNTWVDDNDQGGGRPASIKVKLTRGGTQEGETLELNAANNWSGDFVNVPANNDNGTPITYQIGYVNYPIEYDAQVTGDAATGFTITSTLKTTSVQLMTSWQDRNQTDQRPSSIRVQLFANNREYRTVDLTAATGWNYTFTGLPIFENGEYIKYAVSRSVVPGYRTVDSSNEVHYYDMATGEKTAPDSLRVIMWNYPQTTSVEAVKHWADGDDKDHSRAQSVKVKLLADGEEAGTADLSETNNWRHVFGNLPVYKNGAKITYTLEEVNDNGTAANPDGYVSRVDTGDLEVTATTNGLINNLASRSADIHVHQTWINPSNPDTAIPNDITVNLLANGTVINTQKLSPSNNWEYTFSNLPVVYDDNGRSRPINYTVTTDSYAKETSTISIGAITGVGVVNVATPSYFSASVVNTKIDNITVSKEWVDDNDAKGKRPESVTVQLYADGEPSGAPVVLNEAGQWKHVYEDMPLYEYSAKTGTSREIKYTVKEVNTPEGYTASVDDSDVTNLVVTNTIIPVSQPQVPSTPPTTPSTVPTTPTTPSPKSKPKQLAKTGSDVIAFGMGAMIMVSLAGATLVIRKKISY